MSSTAIPVKTLSQWLHSGFENRRSDKILGGLLFLTTVYFVSHDIVKDSSSYLRPADEFCHKQDTAEEDATTTCSRPDLFAFQVGSGMAIFFCGITGFIAWHKTKRAHTAIPSTAEGRLFGYLEESDRLAMANFTFQIWDFIVSLAIPEHATPIMLAHHLLAALVSWCSFTNQYLHYYGVFFLGCTEVSSIFLVFIDLAKYFPPVPGTLFDIVVAICRPAFVVTFFYYRVYAWWKVSFTLWTDAFYVLQNGVAEKHRPGQSYVLYIFLTANALLGVLQLYWFGLILQEVAKVLRG